MKTEDGSAYLSAFVIIDSNVSANVSNFQFFTGNRRLEAYRSPISRPRNTEEILQRLSEIKPISSLPTIQNTTPHSTNQFGNSTVISPPQTTQGDITSNPPSRINAGFFYQWILSNIVGIGIGLFIRSIFSGAVFSIFGSNVGYRYAMLAAIVALFPLEIMQWLVLRQRIKFNFWSLIEILFGCLTGLFLGTFTGRFIFGYQGQLIGAVIGVIAGTSVAKWLTIRRQIKNTLFWFLVSLVGIAISVFLGVIGALIAFLLLSQTTNTNFASAISFASGVLIMTFLSSFITGIGLFRIFRNVVSGE